MYGDFLDKDGRYAAVRRVPGDRAAAVGRGDRRLRRRAPRRRRRVARPDPRPGAGDLLRRLLAGGRPGRCSARRRLPHLGRAAGGGRREDRLDPRARRRGGARRTGRSGSASGCTRSPATRPPRRGRRPTGCSPQIPGRRDPAGPGRPAPQRVRGAAADARPARRQLGQPRDLPQRLGRHRPGAGRRGHRAGRQPRGGRRPDRGVRRARHRRVHPVRLPAPRGRLLVRRGRAADPGRARPLEGPAAAAAPQRGGAVRDRRKGARRDRHERPDHRRGGGRQPEAGRAARSPPRPTSPAS